MRVTSNTVIQELHSLMGSKNRYTVAYARFSNGTVEVVNKNLLKIMRSLLNEFRVARQDWPKLLVDVQFALNHCPSRSLAGQASRDSFYWTTQGNPCS